MHQASTNQSFLLLSKLSSFLVGTKLFSEDIEAVAILPSLS
jgi:hypothetical protein